MHSTSALRLRWRCAATDAVRASAQAEHWLGGGARFRPPEHADVPNDVRYVGEPRRAIDMNRNLFDHTDRRIRDVCCVRAGTR